MRPTSRRMHRVLIRLCWWLAVFIAPVLHAASLQEDVRAADAQRVMATIAGDADRVANLLSDDLRYGHADGRVQTKDEFLAAVRSSRMRYEAYDYEEMQIDRASDDIAVITGRASLRVRTAEQHLAFRLRFLAVWRHEAGNWRLLAYQSAQLPAPSAP
jgi:ketosteroid isomerase-like protein